MLRATRLVIVVLASLASRVAVAVPPSPPAAILIEAASGETIAETRADEVKPAGSFGQLMIILLGLERAALDQLPLDAPVAVSAEATAGTAVGKGEAVVPLHTDRTYLLSDLMKAMLLSAADTAAVAVAEAIAGSVPLSLGAMNERARMLGMTNSRFAVASGVPGGVKSASETTARDLARLARALVAFPKFLEWSSLKGLPFDSGTVLLRNPNQLLDRVKGADGLRVSVEGEPHAIIATAQRGSMRLIAVVLGAADEVACYKTASELLESGFSRYQRVEVLRAGDRLGLSVEVRHGRVPSIAPVVAAPFSVLLESGQRRRMTLRYQVPDSIRAPLAEGDTIGELLIEEGGRLVGVVPVQNPADVAAVGLF